MLCKKEKKYLEKIEKCPSNRSIRDYEIKYEKVKREREMTNLKCNIYLLKILILSFINN